MRPRSLAALAVAALAAALGACHLLLDITDPELAAPDAIVDAASSEPDAPPPDAIADAEVPDADVSDAEVSDAHTVDAEVPDAACQPRKICQLNQVVDSCTGRVFQTCSAGTFCCGDSQGARCVAPSLCDI